MNWPSIKSGNISDISWIDIIDNSRGMPEGLPRSVSMCHIHVNSLDISPIFSMCHIHVNSLFIPEFTSLRTWTAFPLIFMRDDRTDQYSLAGIDFLYYYVFVFRYLIFSFAHYAYVIVARFLPDFSPILWLWIMSAALGVGPRICGQTINIRFGITGHNNIRNPFQPPILSVLSSTQEYQ